MPPKLQQDGCSKAKKTLDPILTLQISHLEDHKRQTTLSVETSALSAVTSLCFLDNNPRRTNQQQCHDKKQSNEKEDSSDDSSSDDGDDDLNFRCRQLVADEKKSDQDVTAAAREVAASMSLQGRFLGTCHSNGKTLLWDLGQRKSIQSLTTTTNRGPGLCLRRVDDDETISKFLYQTRDPAGTVTLHDLNTSSSSSSSSTVASRFETSSQTFCTAAPCVGNPNLVALPSRENSFAVVRDWRVPGTHHPVALFHGAEGVVGKGGSSFSPDKIRKHGMLMSLSMAESKNGAATVIACGMESGTLFFHDLAKVNGSQTIASVERHEPCSLSLSKDPIMSLDMAQSSLPASGFVAIAGLAGNAANVSELDESERGRIALVKASLQDDGKLHARLRTRLATCQVTGNNNKNEATTGGKPGVALCRFRRDGRIFAVGGWDKRVRIFDRSAATSAAPLAILRGHSESVNAMDWAPDAAESGLLATGASDGRVYVWRCFSSVSSK